MKKLITAVLLMLTITASAFAGSHHGGSHGHVHSSSCGHTWRY